MEDLSIINQKILKSLLLNNYELINMCHAYLYTSDLNNKKWFYSELNGALCTVVDFNKKVAKFIMFDLKSYEMIFECEFYRNFNLFYTRTNENFHCFEIKNGFIGFLIKNKKKAEDLFNVVASLTDQIIFKIIKERKIINISLIKEKFKINLGLLQQKLKNEYFFKDADLMEYTMEINLKGIEKVLNLIEVDENNKSFIVKGNNEEIDDLANKVKSVKYAEKQNLTVSDMRSYAIEIYKNVINSLKQEKELLNLSSKKKENDNTKQKETMKTIVKETSKPITQTKDTKLPINVPSEPIVPNVPTVPKAVPSVPTVPKAVPSVPSIPSIPKTPIPVPQTKIVDSKQNNQKKTPAPSNPEGGKADLLAEIRNKALKMPLKKVEVVEKIGLDLGRVVDPNAPKNVEKKPEQFKPTMNAPKMDFMSELRSKLERKSNLIPNSEPVIENKNEPVIKATTINNNFSNQNENKNQKLNDLFGKKVNDRPLTTQNDKPLITSSEKPINTMPISKPTIPINQPNVNSNTINKKPITNNVYSNPEKVPKSNEIKSIIPNNVNSNTGSEAKPVSAFAARLSAFNNMPIIAPIKSVDMIPKNDGERKTIVENNINNQNEPKFENKGVNIMGSINNNTNINSNTIPNKSNQINIDQSKQLIQSNTTSEKPPNVLKTNNLFPPQSNNQQKNTQKPDIKPSISAKPSVPSTPSIPSIPSVPSIPTVPSVPKAPSVPSVPISVPSIPKIAPKVTPVINKQSNKPSTNTNPEASKGALLEQIRSGMRLKKVETVEKNSLDVFFKKDHSSESNQVTTTSIPGGQPPIIKGDLMSELRARMNKNK